MREPGFKNQESRRIINRLFYLDSCLLLLDSNELLLNQMTQSVNHGTKVMQGFGGQMNKLDKQNSFHDIVLFCDTNMALPTKKREYY